MWIFGYGSLMWDNWDKTYDSRQRTRARLNGYVRSFTKASVKNWGTPEAPGPTLTLIERPNGHCDGVAFEFDEDRADEVLAYLQKREGKNFERIIRKITDEKGKTIDAEIFRYGGKNTIVGRSDEEIAAMISVASGTEGRALDYVANCKMQLDSQGIADAAVDNVWVAVQKITRGVDGAAI